MSEAVSSPCWYIKDGDPIPKKDAPVKYQGRVIGHVTFVGPRIRGYDVLVMAELDEVLPFEAGVVLETVAETVEARFIPAVESRGHAEAR